MEPRIYEYASRTRWTEQHMGVLSSESKSNIEIACPPEFGGHVGYWTPEHLFVSSVEVCIMTTFLSLFEKGGGVLVSYDSQSVGRASIRDWVFRFTDITIRPSLVVKRTEDIGLARDAMKKAADDCLICRALKFKPVVEPVIESVNQ